MLGSREVERWELAEVQKHSRFSRNVEGGPTPVNATLTITRQPAELLFLSRGDSRGAIIGRQAEAREAVA